MQLSVTASDVSKYDWFVDGVRQSLSTTASFTFDSAGFSFGRHTVTVVLTKGSAVYSNFVYVQVIH